MHAPRHSHPTQGRAPRDRVGLSARLDRQCIRRLKATTHHSADFFLNIDERLSHSAATLSDLQLQCNPSRRTTKFFDSSSLPSFSFVGQGADPQLDGRERCRPKPIRKCRADVPNRRTGRNVDGVLDIFRANTVRNCVAEEFCHAPCVPPCIHKLPVLGGAR